MCERLAAGESDIGMPTDHGACSQVIEFESSPLLMVGHALGLQVSLIAYPVVSIKKVSSPLRECMSSFPGVHACAVACCADFTFSW